MKKRFLLLFLFMAACGFSQSVNDYKAVIVPVRYSFLKNDNEYRLNTLTKYNLKKAGFEAFYSNETVPNEYNDRCSLLYADVKKESGLLVTKLLVTFSDCKGGIVFQSAIGKSKDKEYQTAYTEALNEAFQSVYSLQYKYSGNMISKVDHEEVKAEPVTVPVVVAEAAKVSNENAVIDDKGLNMLYAQATSFGFQMVDSVSKVIMKVYKTSSPICYIAVKENTQGVLLFRDNQWYFEYYQNEKLISKRIAVKF